MGLYYMDGMCGIYMISGNVYMFPLRLISDSSWYDIGMDQVWIQNRYVYSGFPKVGVQ